MRLLNCETFKLEFFPDRPYPQYAILSHTWGPTSTEVTFRELEDGTASQKNEGFQKIVYACKQAKADNIQYVWVDTCCIDKQSSAELSESINSMFSWYKEATVCYAYLVDVPPGEDPTTSEKFARSRWFTRGWTLQELIAPKSVIFYSRNWVEVGTRAAFANVISNITRIDEGILTGMQTLKHVSVAKRMSWASDRQTTRREDIAYCLMGLFDINMAMLYGEGGEKAFRRLQEEIMKDSDDETLFAWTNTREAQSELQGLLAKSPVDFRNSGHYIPDCDRSDRVPYSITSQGLCITLGLTLLEGDVWICALKCPVPPKYEESLAIYLKKLDTEGQQYARINADRLCKILHRGPMQTVYIRQYPLIPGFDDVYVHHAFQLRNAYILVEGSTTQYTISEREYQVTGTAAHPLSKAVRLLPTSAPNWLPPECKKTFEISRGLTQLAGTLEMMRPDGTSVIIILGSKPGFGVAVDVVELDGIAERTSQTEKNVSLYSNVEANRLLEEYFRSLEHCFDPQPPGTWIDLGKDRFRINIQARKYAGIRYYMVDIFIEETPIVTMAELRSLPVVGGLVASLPTSEQDIDLARARKKWKNLFKSGKP